MSDLNDQTAGQVAQLLKDELTSKEKIRVWSNIRQHEGTSSSSRLQSRVRRRGFGYAGVAASCVTGLVLVWLVVIGVLRNPQSGTPWQLVEGSTLPAVARPSFIITHLNVLYVGVSIVLFLLCTWGTVRLLTPVIELRVRGRSVLENARGKRRWFVWAVLMVVLALSALEIVDQVQGGPLGREYQRGNIGGMQLRTRESILLVTMPIENHTFLPVHIISVEASSDVSGLTIQGGVTKNPPVSSGIILPNPAEERFIHGTVTIPSEARNPRLDWSSM
ncbi:MAG: hypothetical protein K6T83_01865 [Alicyclobacillus sp.]|nr:hypothetical protein [Alicyclobacillus sp.]